MTIKDITLNVLDYTDYRKFLADYYEAMKQRTPYFSYRYFSRQAGFTSPNFLKLVMDGKRNLSAEGIEKFLKAIKFKAEEARHFRLLVLMNQATTPEERDFYTRQLFKSRVYKNLKPLSEAQYEYFSEWFLIPLRELVGRSDFQNDPDWIAGQFLPSLTATQARDGLKTLEKLGLILPTDDGSYRQSEKIVSSGDEVTGQGIKNYHRQMILKGSEAIDRFPGKDRDISSLTLGLSESNIKRIKGLIQDFRKELLAIADEAQDTEQVVQINFQLFPLSKRKGEESDQ